MDIFKYKTNIQNDLKKKLLLLFIKQLKADHFELMFTLFSWLYSATMHVCILHVHPKSFLLYKLSEIAKMHRSYI